MTVGRKNVPEDKASSLSELLPTRSFSPRATPSLECQRGLGEKVRDLLTTAGGHNRRPGRGLRIAT
jgi:hypothetical protein